MLFETTDKKTQHTTAAPVRKAVPQAAKPAPQPVKKTPVQTAVKRPAPVFMMAKKTPTSAVIPPKQLIKGWPTRQELIKPIAVTRTTVRRLQPAMAAGRPAAASAARPTITARAGRKIMRKPGITPAAGLPKKVITYRRPAAGVPVQKPVRGWAHYRQGIRRPVLSTAVYAQPQRTTTTVQRPVTYTRPARQGVRPAVPQGCPPQRVVYRRSAPVARPVYTAPAAAPRPVSTAPAQPAAKPHVCHNCGSKTKGCTTLSRFAFKSTQLTAAHRSQLRDLASKIVRQQIRAVIATGHTDSSGPKDYNKILGSKRATAVVSALSKQLDAIKPGTAAGIFWKVISSGEARPVSTTDAAANRRVHICLRRMAA